MTEQMKPSGIDCIGLMPIDWKIEPMKYRVSFHNGDRGENYPTKAEITSHGIPFINAGHLLEGCLDMDNMDFITPEKYKMMGGVKLKKNDILFNGHTHVSKIEECDGFLYCNPGSVSIPKENSHHGYMILENGVFTWKNLEGEVIKVYSIRNS